MNVGYLPNSFDLFNVAHLDLVASAAAACEHLVVAVLDDESVLARTGRPPVVPLAERVEIVRHVRGVDEVVVHRADADLSGHTVMVADGDQGGFGGPVVVLPASRTSASTILQHALRPVAAGAVA